MNIQAKYIAIGISFLLVACSAQYEDKAVYVEEAEYTEEIVEQLRENRAKLKSGQIDLAPRSAHKDNLYIHSIAAKVNQDTSKKFIRKVNMKFRVTEVEQATYRIENSLQKFDGYVSYTHLSTEVTSSYNIEVAKDSIMEITYYDVVNKMTLRVPNQNLDTTLKEIAGVIDFLDYRTIKASNVTLDLLAKQLEKKRNADYQKRLKALKVGKNDTAVNVQQLEREIFKRQAEKDKALLERLSLEDEIDFSTIVLEIYQPMTFQLSYPLQAHVKSYKPGFMDILVTSIESGWNILVALFIFIIEYWSAWLIFAGIYFLGRYVYRKIKQD